jgi:hypothetical protein
MPMYDVKVIVEYFMEIEADNEEAAEQEGWNYEDYAYNAEVYSIDVDEQPEPEEEEEGKDESTD